MEQPSWKHSDIFPIIARVIAAEHERHPRFVAAQEIATVLLRDPEASVIIDSAREQQRDWSPEHTASNMVAWFSQRITVDESEWKERFERTKIDGQWAYKPAATPNI